MEKVKDTDTLIQKSYENGGSLYKNAFFEIFDKYIMKLYMEKLSSIKAKTRIEGQKIDKLDELPVSFMQSVYQSRFTDDDQWEALKPGNIHLDDWKEIKKTAPQRSNLRSMKLTARRKIIVKHLQLKREDKMKEKS